MANTLAKYNERYSTNEHILKVIDYLWKIEEIKESYGENSVNKKSYKDIVEDFNRKYKNNKKSDFRIPTEYEKELFLRFFEEIQFSIDEGALCEYQVKELFLYYANIADDMGETFVKDYDKGCWRQFKRFIKTMNAL